MKKIINFFYKNNIGISILTSFIIFLLITIVAIINGFTPFGNNSSATMDANIQYVDFFAFFKDILQGKNSIFTLSATLGNNSIGIISYYLTSPFNVLILFFSKANIQTFFNLIVCLKLATCGFTFSYYLQKRFEDKIPLVFIIVLSICYALMQYNIAQASNIMWLDGVYMLPIMLLGLYKTINNKDIKLLSISTSLSIIFNWYTGGINCLFSAFWFLVEEIIKIQNQKQRLKDIAKDAMKYIYAMIVGVMISCILFLPTIMSLRGGRGSSFDWSVLKNTFRGNILSTIQNYYIGTKSSANVLSIFCGSIPLLGCLGFFISKNENHKTKIVLGVSLLMALMFCYWQPFFFMFSLLKDASSYYYRYSYIIIFVLMFIAAYYYKHIEKEKNLNYLIYASGTFSLLLLLLNFVKNNNNEKHIYYSIILLITISITIFYLINNNNKDTKKWFNIAILLLVIIETGWSSKILMKEYSFNGIDSFKKYSTEQQKQVDTIKENDIGLYRISQTDSRNMGANNIRANYNESLAYNYMSNTGYTSCQDYSQLEFLDKLGYRNEADNMNITNTSIIGADSFLGVKYILSSYDIKGLNKLDIEKANNKHVYENPYALSMAFLCKNNSNEYNNYVNPFEYQNEIYSKILGKSLLIYKKIEPSKIEQINKQKIRYEFNIPNGNYALYGSLPWKKKINEVININNRYTTNYACWLSPNVFYINYENNQAFVEVSTQNELSIKEHQFYLLDLSILKYATDKINENTVKNIEIKKNLIKCSVEGKENEVLVTSIPYIKGMKFYRNGKKIEANKFENCLITIPLVEGRNDIEIKIEIPGFKLGVLISILGILIVILDELYKKNNKMLFCFK